MDIRARASQSLSQKSGLATPHRGRALAAGAGRPLYGLTLLGQALRAEARKENIPNLPIVRPDSTQEEAKAALQPIIQGVADYIASIGLPKRKIRDALIEKLQNGTVRALGIETKPKNTRSEVEVAAYFFEDKPNISWERSVIENFGIRYEHVRVFDGRALGRGLVEKPMVPTPSSAAGRPSKKVEIEQVIASIVSKRIAIETMARKAAYSIIRDEAGAMGIDTSIGYSDPVIQRALLTRFGKRVSSKYRN